MRTTRRYLGCCTSRCTSTTIVFCIFALVTLPVRTVSSRVPAPPVRSEHDASLPHHGHPLLRRAFALAHTGLRRLLGERLVRENPDPQFAAAFDEPRNRHT